MQKLHPDPPIAVEPGRWVTILVSRYEGFRPLFGQLEFSIGMFGPQLLRGGLAGAVQLRCVPPCRVSVLVPRALYVRGIKHVVRLRTEELHMPVPIVSFGELDVVRFVTLFSSRLPHPGPRGPAAPRARARGRAPAGRAGGG